MKRMRSLSATGAFFLSVFGGVVLLSMAVASSPAPALADSGGMDGKAIFLAQKCDLCHSVPTAGIEAKMKSEKMRGPDLVNLGAERDAAWLKQYLKKEVDLDGKKHGKAFTAGDAELDTLVAWLLDQKK